jgi:hypothetical protein
MPYKILCETKRGLELGNLHREERFGVEQQRGC